MTKSERAALREHWRQIVTECENRDASISKRAWCEEHGTAETESSSAAPKATCRCSE